MVVLCRSAPSMLNNTSCHLWDLCINLPVSHPYMWNSAAISCVMLSDCVWFVLGRHVLIGFLSTDGPHALVLCAAATQDSLPSPLDACMLISHLPCFPLPLWIHHVPTLEDTKLHLLAPDAPGMIHHPWGRWMSTICSRSMWLGHWLPVIYYELSIQTSTFYYIRFIFIFIFGR